MADIIAAFTGLNRPGSNFGPGQVRMGGLVYPRREHAYQAHKEKDPRARQAYTDPGLTAGAAKRMGRRADLRPDWIEVRKMVMLRVVLAAFTQNRDLRRWLAATGDAQLVEGNHWHDNFWGNCLCDRCGGGDLKYGMNYLGVILMAVRDVLRPD